MLKLIGISDYRSVRDGVVLLDARSEGEFEQGHIPGALSYPILNNAERIRVGTCYKQEGHEPAVLLGYELAGPKFRELLERAYQEFRGKKIVVHCWRGGLRSLILGNLLLSAGFDVSVIRGGYKTYRNLIIEFLSQDFNFMVLGGKTGSGKSEILREMLVQGAQVLDLEALASHKGSAFGALGMAPQPSQEQFENNLFEVLATFDPTQPVWAEDESRLIGKRQIPNQIYHAIRNGFVYYLDYPFEYRLKHIITWYGSFPVPTLAEITGKLRKRMGDMENRKAIDALQTGDLAGWAATVLRHYDKQYEFGFGLRSPDSTMVLNDTGKELLKRLLAKRGINRN